VSRPLVAVVGFGELGEALVRTVAAGQDGVPVAPGRDAPADVAWRERVATAGGRPAGWREAIGGADLVLVCVPGTACVEVAERAAPLLRQGTVWADLSTAAPEAKEAAARAVAPARYADVAVLGTAVASGGQVPLLASGEGANELAGAATALGLVVEAFSGPPGAAARVKLLRSVYMKGRDALVAEMMAAARAHGLDGVVAGSIRGPGEEVAFPELSARILSSLERHAARRADELAAAADLLRATGVEPVATEGAERRLRRAADGQR
jgi:3-hydroxyisobutyrate dehydrogenase-like beta-hydroxyacid dehydrogenase